MLPSVKAESIPVVSYIYKYHFMNLTVLWNSVSIFTMEAHHPLLPVTPENKVIYSDVSAYDGVGTRDVQSQT